MTYPTQPLRPATTAAMFSCYFLLHKMAAPREEA